ncbi:hypothetical protein CRG98_005782 [Punica granatum]|uniref:Uncharacterized protein n=1 Tax=Punica granatum TaxID=22663 RepID=A0A2I0KZ97_PUNGR|nr:hypothetical protein CRG98_005782 [Punica granatum]
MPWVAVILPTRVRYSSMVGVSSVPWMLKTAWAGSQNVTDAPKKFQSTRQMASIGISPTKQTKQARTSPNILSVSSGVAKLCAPELRLVRARMRAPKCNAAWDCPPSRGCATDAREKESPLPVYDPKVEGRGRSVNKKNSPDLLGCWDNGPNWAEGLTGPTGGDTGGLSLESGLGRIRPLPGRADCWTGVCCDWAGLPRVGLLAFTGVPWVPVVCGGIGSGIRSGFERRKTSTAASELGAPLELEAEKLELRDQHQLRENVVRDSVG